jgi:transposase-like protein
MEQALGKVFKKGKPRSLRKGTEPYELRFKSRIITEYLKGDKSYAMLGRQYKINPGIVSRWVRIARQGRAVKAKPQKISKFTGMKEGLNKTLEQLQQDNQSLRRRLQDEELKNLILEKVLEIGKRDYNIDLKKKYEAKRPLK